MTLTEFINDKVAIAKDFRGLSKYNPVEIVVENGVHKFSILVSHLEPDTLTVPYNVSWINANPEHKDYLTLMRRVDAEKYDDSNYRGSWAVLTTVEEIFNEEQYFKKDSDPILGEIDKFRPPLASISLAGGFFLATDAADEESPIAVGTNDLRMTNARTPKPHTHVKEPITMISAGDGSGKYIAATTNDPVAGDMLFITGTDEDGNYIGEWLPPTTEFAYLGPRPTTINIVGPVDMVNGNSNQILRADVNFDDGTKIQNAKVVWTITPNSENSDKGTINPATGVFHANLVAVDTPVHVTATFTHEESGAVVTVDYIITIKGDPTLVILNSIRIDGPATFNKDATGTYTVVATYSDNSTRTVTPNVFTSSNTNAGTFTGGKLTPKAGQIYDVSTKLSATYVENGVTRSATLDVKIVDPVVYPKTITIVGAAQVNQNEATALKAHVVYTDGTEGDVNGAWTVTSNTYATIAQTGILTAKELLTQGSQSVEVNVSFTSNTITVTAKKTIAIVDNKIWPVSGKIDGPATVATSGVAQYVYTVTYSDGSTDEKNPEWSVTDGTVGNIVAGTGEFTATTKVGTTTVRATYSEGGKNLNATKSVSVEVVAEVLPALRYGVAMFSNKEFTGGPIADEITQDEADYGVTAETSPSGKQYTHWTGLADFVSKVMTNTLDLKVGDAPKNITTTIDVDEYIYVMWPASAGNTYIVDLANSFNVTFDGINYRNDVLGNSEGLPGYDANLPKTLTVDYDDGTGTRPWIIVRAEATTLPEYAPRTDNYSIKYV
jgi:hypothetical protein